MLFSAYQIESLLADFQQTDSPAGKSASETLSLSADAIQDARQYLRPLKRSPLNWVTPKILGDWSKTFLLTILL